MTDSENILKAAEEYNAIGMELAEKFLAGEDSSTPDMQTLYAQYIEAEKALAESLKGTKIVYDDGYTITL